MKHMQDMARVATGLGVVIKESMDNLRIVATCLKSSTVETLESLATFVLDIARVTRDRTYEYERHAQAQQRQQDLFRNQKRETLSIAQKKESRQERSPMPQSEELFAPRNRKACRKEFRTSNVSFGKASSLFHRVGLPSVGEEVFRDKDASEDEESLQEVAKEEELAMECDYVLEAANQKRFKELLKKRITYITSVV